jgi:hypothetical protein
MENILDNHKLSFFKAMTVKILIFPVVTFHNIADAYKRLQSTCRLRLQYVGDDVCRGEKQSGY